MSETTTDYRAIAHELLLATIARMEKFPREPFWMAGAFAIPWECLDAPLRERYIDEFIACLFSTRTLSSHDLALSEPPEGSTYIESRGGGVRSRMLITPNPLAQRDLFHFTALTDELVPA